MIKAKLVSGGQECTILGFVAAGANNVVHAVVTYADGEVDALPLHEVRVEVAPKTTRRAKAE